MVELTGVPKARPSEERAMLNEMLSADATHWLHCSHAQGRSVSYYKMKCVVLKEMPNERLKILVFGERNWKGRDHVKKVRYVDAERVTKADN